MYGSQTGLQLSPQNAFPVHGLSLELHQTFPAVDKHSHTLSDTTCTAFHSGCLLLENHPEHKQYAQLIHHFNSI
jgi:hypothetical protein